MPERPGGSVSGLTDDEAKEFHSLFMYGFTVFVAVAAVAHFLVWLWRPWLPSIRGYVASVCDLPQIAALAQNFVG